MNKANLIQLSAALKITIERQECNIKVKKKTGIGTHKLCIHIHGLLQLYNLVYTRVTLRQATRAPILHMQSGRFFFFLFFILTCLLFASLDSSICIRDAYSKKNCRDSDFKQLTTLIRLAESSVVCRAKV